MYISLHEFTGTTCMQKPEEAVRSSEAGITGCCEPPDTGARNGPRVLCRNRRLYTFNVQASLWPHSYLHLIAQRINRPFFLTPQQQLPFTLNVGAVGHACGASVLLESHSARLEEGNKTIHRHQVSPQISLPSSAPFPRLFIPFHT